MSDQRRPKDGDPIYDAPNGLGGAQARVLKAIGDIHDDKSWTVDYLGHGGKSRGTIFLSGEHWAFVPDVWRKRL